MVSGLAAQKNGTGDVTVTAISNSPDRSRVTFALTSTVAAAAGVKVGAVICLGW
ncbi:hypothetical protein [Ferrovum myxofaciens]|uniref:hypothetical protein n=1 Tax=Ferrovum myxofaciens TaxID=416213 RepID=UPI003EB69CF5